MTMPDLQSQVQKRLYKLTVVELREVAGEIGVSVSLLSQIRQGNYPHAVAYQTLAKCAEHLRTRRSRKAA